MTAIYFLLHFENFDQLTTFPNNQLCFYPNLTHVPVRTRIYAYLTVGLQRLGSGKQAEYAP